jgi:hypothetical protein
MAVLDGLTVKMFVLGDWMILSFRKKSFKIQISIHKNHEVEFGIKRVLNVSQADDKFI